MGGDDRLDLMNVDLVDACLGDLDGLGSAGISAGGHSAGGVDGLGWHVGVEHQAVVVLRGGDGDAETSVIGQLAQGDLEVCVRPVGTIDSE